MTTLTIIIDERTEADLHRMSTAEGTDASRVAARLLADAVQAVRPRPKFDRTALEAYAAEYHAEEVALADSDLAHRVELLSAEDKV